MLGQSWRLLLESYRRTEECTESQCEERVRDTITGTDKNQHEMLHSFQKPAMVAELYHHRNRVQHKHGSARSRVLSGRDFTVSGDRKAYCSLIALSKNLADSLKVVLLFRFRPPHAGFCRWQTGIIESVVIACQESKLLPQGMAS